MSAETILLLKELGRALATVTLLPLAFVHLASGLRILFLDKNTYRRCQQGKADICDHILGDRM